MFEKDKSSKIDLFFPSCFMLIPYLLSWFGEILLFLTIEKPFLILNNFRLLFFYKFQGIKNLAPKKSENSGFYTFQGIKK